MAGLSRAHRFAEAQSYILYYGHVHSGQLSSFDLAIVEPAGLPDDGLHRLQLEGTLAAAYLSMLEIRRDDPFFPRLRRDDFVLVNGKPWENERFDTVNADPRSPVWAQELSRRAGELLSDRRFDGLFIDTVGNLDDSVLPAGLRTELLAGWLRLLYDLRRRYPGHLLIQNNGLEHVLPRSFPFLDGVCWENPPVDDPQGVRWCERQAAALGKLCEEPHFRVLLLTEEGMNYSPKGTGWLRRTAERCGMLYHHASKDYVNGISARSEE